MPILADNLKFFAAALMDDSPLGGGPASPVEIIDGASNQIFNDVGEIDRAAGATSLRKVYPAVRTPDTAILLGANIIVSEPPTDPYTDITTFPAASVSETQSDVITRIGAYTGTLPDNVRDLVSTEAYLLEYMPPGATIPGGTTTVGANGAFRFQSTPDLYLAAEAHFVAGSVMTLMDFYNDNAVQVEAFSVAQLHLVNAGIYLHNLIIEFDAPSAYPVWSAANSYWSTTSGPKAYGTYFYESSAGLGLKKFEYYGSSRLASSVSVGATTLSVESVTAGIVAEDLVTSPEAESILGFRPGQLTKSANGREPIFKVGRMVIVGKDITSGPTSFTPGTVTLSDAPLKRIKVMGVDGSRITSGWTVNLDTGVVTISSVAGWSLPATIVGRAEEMAMITAISGVTLTIGRALSRGYPAGSSVASALVLRNIRARITALFDQATWTGVWSDDLVGSGASAEFNSANYPIVVTNDGAITERWRIVFTSATAFVVIGSQVGQIGVGDTAHDCSPINPATSTPYFTIPALGWGAGWSAGNLLRLNTESAAPPVWLLRCVQQSPESLESDKFEIALRGGVDRT